MYRLPPENRSLTVAALWSALMLYSADTESAPKQSRDRQGSGSSRAANTSGSHIARLRCPCRTVRSREPHMGTAVRITIYAPDPSAIPFAFARIRELDQKLSDYKRTVS